MLTSLGIRLLSRATRPSPCDRVLPVRAQYVRGPACHGSHPWLATVRDDPRSLAGSLSVVAPARSSAPAAPDACTSSAPRSKQLQREVHEAVTVSWKRASPPGPVPWSPFGWYRPCDNRSRSPPGHQPERRPATSWRRRPCVYEPAPNRHGCHLRVECGPAVTNLTGAICALSTNACLQVLDWSPVIPRVRPPHGTSACA